MTASNRAVQSAIIAANAAREKLGLDVIGFDVSDQLGIAEVFLEGRWVLLDYFDYVVHVFSKHARDFYALDRLWGNAIRIEFKNES